MQFSKIDANLASALSGSGGDGEAFLVSVRAARALTAAEQREFRQLGGQGVDAKTPIYTATLTRDAIAELSDKPWVRQLTLSRRLKPT